ncbi:MAG: GNAT family N-acetyltransferase [Terriglobia bacterium]
MAEQTQLIDALWEAETAAVRPMFAGRPLFEIKYRGVALTTPFTELSTNMDEAAPRWENSPKDVEVAVISAQPVDCQPKRLVFQPAWIRVVSSVLDRYYIDLSGTFDEYLKKFSAKERYNLLSRVKRFKELSGGELKWGEYLGAAAMSEFYDVAAGVSRKSWHEINGGPGFSGTIPRQQALALAGEARARGYALFQHDSAVAFIYCRAFNTQMLVHTYTSYEEEFRRYAPGMVLNYLMLERLFAEGKYKYLDFSLGVLPYKAFFATHSKPCVEVLYFRRTIRNATLLAAQAALASLSVAGGQWIDKVKLKRRLKALLMGEHARPGQV